jgi:hypothetical protein
MRELIQAPLKRCIPMNHLEWQNFVQRQYSPRKERGRPRDKEVRANRHQEVRLLRGAAGTRKSLAQVISR